MPQRSVILVSYLFPPRGGAGVQRALKLVKYLPRFGWRPLVVANGGTANDTVTRRTDRTLLRDLSDDTVIRYTALTPGEQRHFQAYQSRFWQRLEPTDPMAWWVEPAVRRGLELVADHQPSAIVVTMSPFTAAEVGIRLKKQTDLPLVLDLRDPWAMDETHVYPTRWHAWRDWRRMRRALAWADLIVMNNDASAEAVRREMKLPGWNRVVSITNGYDGEDFTTAAGRVRVDPPKDDVLRIVHTGTFHSDLAERWDAMLQKRGLVGRLKYARRPINLWTRTPRYLLRAMEKVIVDGKLRPEQVELVLCGDLTDADQRLVDASPIRSSVRMLGYRTHDESVGWLLSGDLLFLPLHTPLDGGPALIVPGKTYECLGSGRPVLAMGPPGDMRRFVRETNSGFAIDGDDVAAAAAALVEAHAAKREGRRLFNQDRHKVIAFERREVARRFADELKRTVESTHAAAAGSRLADDQGLTEAAPGYDA
jgi:glycosyltransferase involved in cell wall biosynthesis